MSHREQLLVLKENWYRDQCDPGHLLSLIELVIFMATQVEQLTSDVAALTSAVNSVTDTVTTEISNLTANIADLKAQLAAQAGDNPAIASAIQNIEASTAKLTQVSAAAQAAIAPQTPNSNGTPAQ